jgi:hypothetical protein
MRVRAKFAADKFGFYGTKRRYDGDEFELDDPKHFSSKWMEKLDDDKPKRGRQKAVESHDKDQGAE